MSGRGVAARLRKEVPLKYLGARAATLAVLVMSAVGCAAGDDEGLDSSEHVTTPIVGGSKASAYPEAALLEMSTNGVLKGYCSGAVIAPKVVLTAGHCVTGFTSWTVNAPFLSQTAKSVSAEVFDWKDDGSDKVNRDQHDVGLVFLDSAITVPQYPVLADAPVATGSSVVSIGRIDNGTLSQSALFVSQPLTVASAAPVYPYSYVSKQVIESGDSGGPVVVPGTTPHQLVAVNSGSGASWQVLARVDLVKTWITERMAAHGAPAVAAPAPTAPPPACTGPAEVEPNDDFRAPNALGATACGTLGGTDEQDWYTWTIAGATPYSVKLSAQGNASVVMWKKVGNRWARVANTTPTELSHTSSGAGTYVVAVFTHDGSAQPYALSLTK
jgi:hypothetical protein